MFHSYHRQPSTHGSAWTWRMFLNISVWEWPWKVWTACSRASMAWSWWWRLLRRESCGVQVILISDWLTQHYSNLWLVVADVCKIAVRDSTHLLGHIYCDFFRRPGKPLQGKYSLLIGQYRTLMISDWSRLSLHNQRWKRQVWWIISRPNRGADVESDSSNKNCSYTTISRSVNYII